MGSNTKKTVSFTVKSEDEKQHLIKLAEFKKFKTLSDMARLALYQYINRYKLEEQYAVQRETQKG